MFKFIPNQTEPATFAILLFLGGLFSVSCPILNSISTKLNFIDENLYLFCLALSHNDTTMTTLSAFESDRYPLSEYILNKATLPNMFV